MPPPPGTPKLAPKLRYVIVSLLGMQVYLGVCYNLPALYAPVVSRDLGIPAQSVGLYLGILMIACLVGALSSQLLRRVGALRFVQIGTLLQAAGIALAASGSTFWLMVSAFIVGAGNGMVIPGIIHILSQTAPPGRLSVSIALTQTGTPLGTAFAGAAIPSLIEAVGWRESLLPSVLAGLIFVLAVQPLRQALDRDRDRNARLQSDSLFSPWLLALRDPALRAVGITTLMISLIASVHAAFLVSYLNLELKYSLVLAGLVLTGSQAGVIVGRVLAGWVSDRLGDPLLVLRWLTVAAGLFTIATALLAYGFAGFGLAVVVLAITVCQSWFGVFLAAAARHAPQGKAGMATAGTQLFPITASMIGPILFAALVSLLGRYSSAYLAVGVAGLLVGAGLLLSGRRSSRARSKAT